MAREKFAVCSSSPVTSIRQVTLNGEETLVHALDNDCSARIGRLLDMRLDNIDQSFSDIGERQRQDLEVDALVFLLSKG